MKKIVKKILSIFLSLLLAITITPISAVWAQNADNATKPTTLQTAGQKKQVIGYITQWDAWKDSKAGLPSQGALTHLNIDYSKYTILNYSFFGVANDGSLHSGDYRDKNIYKPEVQQQPQPLLYTDIYSSWDLYLLFGELDAVNYISADIVTKAKAQGFDVKEGSSTWSHPGWGIYNQSLPLPLKKSGGAPGLLELAKQNGVKVNASIGGWSMCKHFPEVAADPIKRAKFIQDCVRLINMGFDGIDLDWEYVGPFDGMNFRGTSADYNNFITLIREIRQAIGSDKLITSCFSANTNKLNNFNWTEIDQYINYYNFMSYDFNGGWSNKAGHNSPLYTYSNAEEPTSTLNDLYQYLSTTNINMSKVTMGVPFYGRGVITQGNAALNAPTVKRSEFIQPDGNITTCVDFTNWPKDVLDGQPSYSYIKKTVLAPNSGWTVNWDNEAKVPYATKGSYFLSYDDETSVGYKAQFAKDKNLAGVIIWDVYHDLEFGGTVTNYGSKLKKWSDVKCPLATKVNEVLNGSTQTVATPILSPNGGTFNTAQNVTISCATPNATIRYTTDGTEPTATSSVYTAPINVAKTTTIKAKSIATGMYDSPTASATFTINTTPIETVATPIFSPSGGTFNTAQNVTITCATAGATIRYTTNGTEPTATSTAYTSAINVSATTTIKAKAIKSGMNDSTTAIASFTISITPIETVATPIISPNGGSFNTAQNVTITCATAGATIRYTTDGTEPTATSTAYTSAINVSATTTVKAKAFKSGLTDSTTASASFTISNSSGTDSGNPTGVPAVPSLSHNNWNNNASYDITFNIWWGNNATAYTLFENDVAIETGSLTANSPNSQSYTWHFTNKSKGTYAYKVEVSNHFGKTTSNTTTSNVINGSVGPIETVTTPTFNPQGGTYANSLSVSISCSTSGATIRYTTDGTEPTTASATYTSAINVSTTTTVKAKAFKSGMNASSTASVTYTIGTTPIQTVATPTFFPTAGTYSSTQNVTINCATAGTTICYTIDGTEPTAASTAYTSSISISATTNLKAKAFKSGMNASSTASATYTIQSGTSVKPWAPNTAYKTGDIVSYNGKYYQCRQPHTSIPSWEPPNVLALWLEYTGPVNPVETVATPIFNPIGGTFTSAQNVTITCETANAIIRYTTNGTEPTVTSTIYSAPINVTNTTTIKAKAFKSGMNDSTTATAIYTINTIPVNTVANPSFNPQGGTYAGSLNVTISCDTANATIYYTINGAEPTTSSSVYSNPITISSTTTLKAKAIKTEMNDSAITTAVYTISSTPITNLPTHILTGYWQNFDNGATCLKISDVPTTYNLIAVAFADATSTPGAVTFNLDSTLSSRLGGYTKQAFINDIAAAKARGQKVILSVGGERGTVSVADATSAANFANSVYALMQEYGFDGVDIDLENGINPTYMGAALRQLSVNVGPSLIIAMAPQTIDMQNTNMGYFRLALDIKDILTVVNTQYYNSGSMLGQDGNVYSQGSVNFLTALATIQLENGLRPDQIGLGLPASPSGAGSGYINPTMVNTALNCLATGTPGGSYVPPRTYPSIRGAMTWSINWDASNNYNFANTVRPTLNALPN
ncbi:chitobiase/beta-hexosaminidase C-terminal domain-containing protein [Paludicola sp. MB14-C6]|uniref:chitobiase/beta-hexosaminidase C-terminal domain-containing protein n=1 Tax=Paludihabitans sp. MB14-C6 TaxID=3070656 RepID=UPI0027DAD458|nr:chitobiase/beta-hexosaminidase C-terminal domain-containing protein [Paludicola sp. MB14-C6]WMJ23960.1 chitobiase/beta-hexosaminidase C-terminal domain-containing protein [Paludicola sp. MB14-C6]